jgi:Kef-type K+ transport system membrane component KefB
MITPIEEHELLVFWTQLFVLVVFARSFGWAVRKIGLPRVIGELLAGLVLGPSIFGEIWPEGFEWFLPGGEVSSSALLAISWVGVALLLVVTGFETDLDLIRRLGRPAAVVTAGSLLLPFIGGIGVGLAIPESFLGEGATRTSFTLFLAAALSVSSLAVVAKILSELGLMRRDFGQITVAVGMVNDVIGWLMLGVFTGLATSGGIEAGEVALTLTLVTLFLVGAMSLGQRAVDGALRQVRKGNEGLTGALTVAIVAMLGFGVLTQWIGVEAVLGAFVAGVVLSRSRFIPDGVLQSIEGLTMAFFAPIFFATAGLRVDLTTLNDAEALVWTGIIVAVAIIAKFIGSYGGALFAGRSNRGALALGAGLNARGALEIVIATVGLSIGVFSSVAFTVVVLVPIVTSTFASVALRAIVRGWQGEPAEVARLEREEALSQNMVVRNSRLLLPSQGGPASIAAAQVLHFAWPPEAAVTVMTVGGADEEVDITPLRNVLHERSLEHRQIGADNPADAIIAEAKLGFGAIGLGLHDSDELDGALLSPLVDDVLSASPIPVVIVRRARNLDGRPLPPAFSRALVPVAGSPASRAATEIAFNLGAQLGTEIVVAHVVNRRPETAGLPRLFARRSTAPKSSDLGELVLRKSVEMADDLGVTALTSVREGTSTADEILDLVRDVDADLVVLGATLRRLDDRPFLGHKVEQVLQHCDATVVVVTVPFEL